MSLPIHQFKSSRRPLWLWELLQTSSTASYITMCANPSIHINYSKQPPPSNPITMSTLIYSHTPPLYTALDRTPKFVVVELAAEVAGGGGGGAVRILLGISIGESSSSPEEIEWLSEMDCDGDGGDRTSSWSCMIFLKSWIDSFSVHSCDNSDMSSCRRPNWKWREGDAFD